jgi:hypothetical protein
MHGLQFGLSQGRVNYWVHSLLPVLQQSLAEMGMKPERDGSQVADLSSASEGGANLSLDATERRLQRPVDGEKQREKYSGKKKTHTDKNLLLANENTKKIIYLSRTVEGKKHDKKLAEESRPQTQKKVRGKQLTKVDKFFNRLISGVRIIIENVICGVKRCRIVKDTLRLTKENIADLVMEIACGLHNLRVTFRQPMKTIDITNLEELSYFK